MDAGSWPLVSVPLMQQSREQIVKRADVITCEFKKGEKKAFEEKTEDDKCGLEVNEELHDVLLTFFIRGILNTERDLTISGWKWNFPPALTPRNCLNNHLSEQTKSLVFFPNNLIAYEPINLSF